MLLRRPIRRVLNFLRAHPVLCLLLLSPGIPEYISGSSALNAMFLSPILFVFQILANLGLYGPGVLLIREAMVRWKKGWGNVLMLGAAYGILEEGIALSTLFDPNASQVGALGSYGHWLGVNWVWLAGIIPVHMIFSISIPILLLGMALPETKGRSLLSSRGVTVALAILGFDVFFLLMFVAYAAGFWMGWPVFVASFAAIGILVCAGYRVPEGLLKAKTVGPRRGPVFFGIAGIAFYPSVLLTQGVGMAIGFPAALIVILIVLVQALFLFYISGTIGASGNERELLAFCLGLILPIASFGVLAEFRLPLTLFADFIMILFFMKLWRKYRGPDFRRAPSPQQITFPPRVVDTRMTSERIPRPHVDALFGSRATLFRSRLHFPLAQTLARMPEELNRSRCFETVGQEATLFSDFLISNLRRCFPRL